MRSCPCRWHRKFGKFNHILHLKNKEILTVFLTYFLYFRVGLHILVQKFFGIDCFYFLLQNLIVLKCKLRIFISQFFIFIKKPPTQCVCVGGFKIIKSFRPLRPRNDKRQNNDPNQEKSSHSRRKRLIVSHRGQRDDQKPSTFINQL